jgi:AcrR family transcriptional regulator
LSNVRTSDTAANQGPRPRRSSAETREHVLAVATGLFYWEGIRSTGVDRVAQAAEVGPTTLYRLFASKDDLVAAYVDRSAAGYRELIGTVTEPSAGPPRERILALFDAIEAQVQPELCRGCPFLMALAEFPDPASPVHAAAVEIKDWVRARLRELAGELHAAGEAQDPAALGDQLALVLEGIYASVQALTAAGPTRQSRAAVEALLDRAGTRA